ncbi:MAG: TonB-dependent receptor [Ignavibacteria bacterium]|nr:MAG: TonB-dependent receptor [Ignavibacteria bacterium]KAF0161588.1 MAG: TonB-dependent receptor [Ignavibacteria bacterium]
MKSLTTIMFFLIGLLSVAAQEKTYNMDEIIVSSGRVPITFNNLSRSVKVFSAKEIKEIPVNNVIDLLKNVSGVDLRARGTEGAQADIAIRGGTFEQTLILIDGVKLTDPQTGHHNLNLPVSLDNIERIEILKGQGARIFGANAFGGAVNIITKKERINSITASLLGGQHGLYEYNLGGSIKTGDLANNISYSKKKTDGYRHNTNFDVENISVRQNYSLGQNQFNLLFGYIDKSFGANSFYSNRFPNQYERTITRIANISAEIPVSGLIVSPKIFYRNSFDDFQLDYMRQNWNRNTHRTESYGGEIQTSFNSSLGITYLGLEFGRDEIRSSNLGARSRSKTGFYAEQMFSPIKDFSISTGLFAYNYSSIGWKFWPGFDVSYNLSEKSKLFASIGKAFRIPTFTELYYVSPANMGNPNLLYEQTTNYEAGFSYQHNYFTSTGSVFLKEGTNLIDWVRAKSTEPWRVENVSNLTTAGTEINVELNTKKISTNSPISSINLGYVYLTSDRKTGGFESKYLLDHLRHQLIISFTNTLLLGIKQNWALRYEERENITSHIIVDTQLSMQFEMFDFFIRATNLFNKTYFDIPGVILPGRWISAGVKFSTNR